MDKGVFAFGGFVLMLVCCLFVGSCCTVYSVPPGNIGLVTSFGKIEETYLADGGPYFVAPWKGVQRVSVQVQRNEEDATVPTKGGLSVQVKANLIYKLDRAKAVGVMKEVGVKYEEKIIDPYFRNAVRDVCAEFSPEALYTSERQTVEDLVFKRVSKELEPRGFVCESVMIQDPRLPAVVTERIQAKVAAEQDAIRMQSVFKQIEQEAMANKRQKELEAEAKVIEAKGISEAQLIIKKDLDSNYLVYLWIEALKENAKNSHATTIYIPTNPATGLPTFAPTEKGK